MDLNAFLCSLNLCVKLGPVCPIYALLQSGHVSLYAPDLLYLSRVWGFGVSSFYSVLLARMVILMSAFLNMFVTKIVSLSKYVKWPHLFVILSGSWVRVAAVGSLGVGVCVCVCVCVCRESIVLHDVVDGVQFFFVFFML